MQKYCSTLLIKRPLVISNGKRGNINQWKEAAQCRTHLHFADEIALITDNPVYLQVIRDDKLIKVELEIN